MVWPTPQEYQEAIQNPQANLGDPELRTGRVGLDVLGLPRPISGNFASVYRVVCGTDVWAVRCFLHPVTDQQQRYAEISRRLQDVRLPYTVGFDYLPRGVRVRGRWYPVLKMAWVQGTPLHEYVRQHLHQPPALLDLASRWLEMSAALQEAAIAHGDLQHGNVLVVDGQPKLIDYDGMFVPALAGRRSHELGHRHYQHPQRTETDFGPQTDRFSSWVIYTALVALAADASLWDRTGAGEEFLLLRDDDFRRPEASATLNALAGHGEPRLRALADLLRTMVRLPLAAVPSLDGSTAPAGGQPLRFAADGSAVRTLPPETDWLSDHLGPATPSRPPPAPPAPPALAPAAGPALGRDAWVLDHMRGPTAGRTPPPAAALGGARLTPPGSLPPRVALACLGVVALLLIVGRLTPGAPPAGALLALAALTLSAGAGALFLLYGRDPAVQTMRAEARAVARLRGEATRLEGDVRAESARRRVIELRLDEMDRRQAAALQELAAHEAAEVRDAQERANRPVRAINDQLAQIDREEAAALKRTGVRTQVVVAQINSALSALKAREQQEGAAAAGAARQQWVERRLRTRRVVQARVPGVGLVHRSALAAFGVVTAADVTYYRARGVPGIGDARAEALARWRRDEEARALAVFPPGAIAAAVAQVRNRYQSQRDALERERATRARELAEAQRQLRTRYERQRQAHSGPLRQAMTKASGRTRRDAGEIAARYAGRRAAILQRNARRRGALRGHLQAHDAGAAATVQRLWQVKWELARREPALSRYGEVSFQRFLRWALLQQPG